MTAIPNWVYYFEPTRILRLGANTPEPGPVPKMRSYYAVPNILQYKRIQNCIATSGLRSS